MEKNKKYKIYAEHDEQHVRESFAISKDRGRELQRHVVDVFASRNYSKNSERIKAVIEEARNHQEIAFLMHVYAYIYNSLERFAEYMENGEFHKVLEMIKDV